MPLLPVDPAHPPPSDRQTVFDALSFAQAPINVTRLAELLADRHTTRGTGFNTTSLRGLLGDERHSHGSLDRGEYEEIH